MKYSIEVFGHVIVVNWHDTANIAELRSALLSIDNYTDYALRLWDFSDTEVDASNIELERLSSFAKENFASEAKVAIVASDDFVFGMSRVYESFRNDERVEFNVFKAKDEALSWLKQSSNESSKKNVGALEESEVNDAGGFSTLPPELCS